MSRREAASAVKKERHSTLGEKTDQAKGHIKEAIGTLAGDEEFTREGPDDRPAGDTREKIRDVQGKGDDVVIGRWTC